MDVIRVSMLNQHQRIVMCVNHIHIIKIKMLKFVRNVQIGEQLVMVNIR